MTPEVRGAALHAIANVGVFVVVLGVGGWFVERWISNLDQRWWR